MEGTHLLLSLLWKAGYKVSQRKVRFARILSNTSGFTCHKENVEWAQEETGHLSHSGPQDLSTD
jgi:hypothetical protein